MLTLIDVVVVCKINSVENKIMKSLKHGCNSGFSLLEVLISLALLAVIVTAFFDMKMKALSSTYENYQDLLIKIEQQNDLEMSWINAKCYANLKDGLCG